MITTLIESRRRSRRSTGSTTASVVAHATLITLVTAVTARADSHPPTSRPPIPEVTTYVPVAETPPARGNTTTSEARPDDRPPLPAPPERQIDVPLDIPTTILPVELSELATDPSDFVSSKHTASGTIGADASAPNGQGGTYTGWQVEKEATPLAGNPRPQYPSLLQSARVDGEVLAQFVIDSSGRVDMSTFRAIRATDELFTEAVKRVLVRWKFQPAEVGGRKVRQLVQMPMTFRMR